MSNTPRDIALQPHPQTADAVLRQAAVRVLRAGADRLQVEYTLQSDMTRLNIPSPTTPVRRDELWRHTCMELFVAGAGSNYCEFNFSPSGEWAAYEFADYRLGMQPAACEAPSIDVWHDAATLRVSVHCYLPESLAQSMVMTSALQMGVTMVIEDNQGGLSYWALTHPNDKPDFHHRDGFTLVL